MRWDVDDDEKKEDEEKDLDDLLDVVDDHEVSSVSEQSWISQREGGTDCHARLGIANQVILNIVICGCVAMGSSGTKCTVS